MSRICIFGDSIACNIGYGWVDKLKDFFKRKNLDYFVNNFSISGNTTTGLLKRFENEIKLEKLEDGDKIFIFAIGINDSQYLKSEQKFKVEEREFKKNLDKLCKIAEKFSSKIIFIGLTPVDENKTDPWTENKIYKNEYIMKYNKIIHVFCSGKENKNIYFIPVVEQFLEYNYKELLEDGLHPNILGHKALFSIIIKDLTIILKMKYERDSDIYSK